MHDQYTDRAVAFIDILGLTESVKLMRDNQKVFDDIIDALLGMQNHTSLGPLIYDDLNMQVFSDSIVLSTPVNAVGFASLIAAIEFLCCDLLKIGFFTRGGLTIGRLLHKEGILVGEGLISAYELESKVSRFPRIVASRKFADKFRSFLNNHEIDSFMGNCIVRANDGPTFVNILRRYNGIAIKLKDHLPLNGLELDWSRDGEITAHMLSTKLAEAVDNPNHYEKVWWFCEYWNREAALAKYLSNPFPLIRQPT